MIEISLCWSKWGKYEESKLLDIFLARYQRSRRELDLERLWHFLFIKKFLANWRIYLLDSVQNYKVHVIQVMEDSSTIPGKPFYSVKPKFGRFRSRETVRNVHLLVRHYHLCYAFSRQKWVSDKQAVFLPRKVSIAPPQVSQLAETKRHRHLCYGRFWGGTEDALGKVGVKLWSEEPDGEDKMAGKAQGSKVRKIFKNVGRISKMVQEYRRGVAPVALGRGNTRS